MSPSGEGLHDNNDADLGLANNAPNARPRLDQVWKALKDPKSWLGGLTNGAAAMNIASLSAFLPTFIHEFGFSFRESKHAGTVTE